MTSLEDEFKKLLGNRYNLYTHLKPYEISSTNVMSNDKDLPNLDILSNNKDDKRCKDIVNIDTKDFVTGITFRLNQLSEQSLATDKELKENVNDLLEKVDKIIEYLHNFHKQIDDKISKEINEQLSK